MAAKFGAAYQRVARQRRHASGLRSRSEYHRLRRYGITQDEYDAMVAERGGQCDICGRIPLPFKDGRGGLDVDHDHETDRIRGLLCRKCNLALAFVEAVEFVTRARAYLERTR